MQTDVDITNDNEIIPMTFQDKSDNFKFIKSPLPKPVFRLLVIGPSGSGKTNNIVNLICRFLRYPDGRSIFSRLYVISQSLLNDTSFATIKQYIDNDKLFMCNDLNLELINGIYNDSTKGQKLLFIDDFAAFKRKMKDETMLNVFFTGRHNNISIIITAQQYQQIPTALRVNATHMCIYEPMNQSLDYIRKENETMKYNGNNFNHLIESVCKDRYNFLFIDKRTNKFYKNYSSVEL